MVKTKSNLISFLIGVFIASLFCFLYFNSKIIKQENQSLLIKDENQKILDSIQVYKKFLNATNSYLEGETTENQFFYDSLNSSIPEFVKTLKLLQSFTPKSSFRTILKENNLIVKDTIYKIDESLLTDLQKTKYDLEVAKSKLNDLQFSNGILNLISTKGKKFQYIGQTKNGDAHGFGIGIFETGSVYKGYWENNQRHGNGIFTWKDNEQYEGDFVNDKREGYGIYQWKNGEIYKGFWKNDMRNGDGKLFTKSSKIKKEGNWVNDELKK